MSESQPPTAPPAGLVGPPSPPSDEELDQYIRTRLALIGVNLDVLPRNRPEAPVDQVRILRSARRLLRQTVPVLSDYSLDPQTVPPEMYPAHLPHVRSSAPRAEGWGEGRSGSFPEGVPRETEG